MTSTRTSLFAIAALVLFFTLAESRVRVTQCPSGTAACSHGTCLQVIGRDGSGKIVNEQRCICDPTYYGEACTTLVDSDFSESVIISPPDRAKAFFIDWLDVQDPVDEKHTYGGGV
nr:EGF region [Hymenolepis microstoma]